MANRRPAVIDSSLILTLAGAGALELFLSTSRYEWHITPLVRGELTRPETREIVDRAIAAGTLQVSAIESTNQPAMDRWTEWEMIVDVGEAEAIAVALSNGWIVGLEDRQAQRALDRREGQGRWINAANLLLDAVADGVLSLADADALFAALDSYPGYLKRGVRSLGQLRVSE
jgi:hypothetical protein